MNGSTTPNHAKVLLHLKWFVNRLSKSFESKLQNSSSIKQKNTDNLTSFSMWNSRNTINSPESVRKSPFAFRSFKFNHNIRGLSDDAENFSSDEQEMEIDKVKRDENCSKLNREISSQMKVRSLTNSPFSQRIPIRNVLNKRRQTFSQRYDSSSELEIKKLKNIISSLPASNQSFESICKSNKFDNFYPPFCDIEQLRLLCIVRSSTESERKSNISRFGQHLCLVYEYQIGFLLGFKAVNLAADYIADLVINAIRIGRLSCLTAKELKLELLFDKKCWPSSNTKLIKTSPLTGTDEQLNWRLGEMWTKPGLRHNEVGGENCHNLNIVTHFLSPNHRVMENKRPDIYGYRHLILLPYIPSSDEQIMLQVNDTNVYQNASVTKNLKFNLDKKSIREERFYELFNQDEKTISISNVKSGAKELDEINSSKGNLENIDSNSTTLRNHLTNSPKSMNEGRSKSRFEKASLTKCSANLRQHLHRVYRPVFFVIFERPSVIEHLSECESFSLFCKRQYICPVMFLNQETGLFDEKSCKFLFQNFDLFTINSRRMVEDPPASSLQMQSSMKHKTMEKSDLKIFNLNSPKFRLNGFDNPGFLY